MLNALKGSALAVAMVTGLLSQASLACAEETAQGASPAGVWLDERGRGAIEIGPCGDKLCGRLVWVKDHKEARSACGLQIIGEVKQTDAAMWNGGWIYSPEMKSRFDVELKPIDATTLEVTGFAGSRELSETMIWRRAPADLGRCSETPRAGYVVAKVEPLGLSPLAAAAPVAGAAVSAVVKARVAVNSDAQKQRRRDAVVEKPAPTQHRKPARVAARGGDRPNHRHTASCHVRAPFVNVTFGCTAKASRVLARLF